LHTRWTDSRLFSFANEGGALEPIHLRHLDVHEHTAELAIRRCIQHREGLATGIKKTAAKLMGISPRALSYYLKKYHVD
jgi:hypothetical protein